MSNFQCERALIRMRPAWLWALIFVVPCAAFGASELCGAFTNYVLAPFATISVVIAVWLHRTQWNERVGSLLIAGNTIMIDGKVFRRILRAEGRLSVRSNDADVTVGVHLFGLRDIEIVVANAYADDLVRALSRPSTTDHERV